MRSLTFQFSIQRSKLVARSLKVTGSTRGISAAMATGVALNAGVAMQFVGVTGELVLLLVLFASLAAGGYAISRDVCTRAGPSLSSLRSIGATSSSLSSALTLSVLFYGIAGAHLGGAVGLALGQYLGGSAMSAPYLLLDVGGIAVAALAATAAGVSMGVRAAWRR